MKNFNLGKRLKVLYELSDVHDRHFYDLCCDHGHLGISVHLNKNPLSTTLNDQVESICLNLEKHVSDIPNVENISTLYKDASKIKFQVQEPKCILIAGVGGPLLLKIVENLIPQINEEDILILSPHTKIHEIRSKLKVLGLTLIEEVYCCENDKHYEMLKVSLNPKGKEITLVGSELWDTKSADIQKYLNGMIKYYRLKVNNDDNQLFKLILSDLIALKSSFK